MHGDIVEIRTQFPSRIYVPGQHNRLPMTLSADDETMMRLRKYLSQSMSSHSLTHLSNIDVLELINDKIENGQFSLVTISDQRMAVVRRFFLEDCAITEELVEAIDCGAPAELRDRRMDYARTFFERSGMKEELIDDAMQAIDFDEEVEIIVATAGTQLFRLEVPGDGQGNWYAEVATATADQRAIASFGEADLDRSAGGKASAEPIADDFVGAPPRRVHAEIKRKVPVEYVVNNPTEMLKTTAAPILDNWSNPTRGASISTRGGGIQYFTTERENIR